MPFKLAREIGDGDDEDDENNFQQLSQIEKKVSGLIHVQGGTHGMIGLNYMGVGRVTVLKRKKEGSSCLIQRNRARLI